MITGLERLQAKKADVVCIRTHSFLGWIIRKLSGAINHSGLIAGDATINKVEIIEALHKVKRHSLFGAYLHRNADVAIFRPTGLSDIQRQMVVARANHYVGADYDYLQLLAHLLDWFLFGLYFFRRFTDDDNYPICSWIIVEAFSVINVDFGVPRGMARPSDIWDYCKGSRDFIQIRELKPLDGYGH